jgi:hypothetical protein
MGGYAQGAVNTKPDQSKRRRDDAKQLVALLLNDTQSLLDPKCVLSAKPTIRCLEVPATALRNSNHISDSTNWQPQVSSQ